MIFLESIGSRASLSANKNEKWRRIHSNAIFRFYLQRPAAGGEGCANAVSKSRRVRDVRLICRMCEASEQIRYHVQM